MKKHQNQCDDDDEDCLRINLKWILQNYYHLRSLIKLTINFNGSPLNYRYFWLPNEYKFVNFDMLSNQWNVKC